MIRVYTLCKRTAYYFCMDCYCFVFGCPFWSAGIRPHTHTQHTYMKKKKPAKIDKAASKYTRLKFEMYAAMCIQKKKKKIIGKTKWPNFTLDILRPKLVKLFIYIWRVGLHVCVRVFLFFFSSLAILWALETETDHSSEWGKKESRFDLLLKG